MYINFQQNRDNRSVIIKTKSSEISIRDNKISRVFSTKYLGIIIIIIIIRRRIFIHTRSIPRKKHNI